MIRVSMEDPTRFFCHWWCREWFDLGVLMIWKEYVLAAGPWIVLGHYLHVEIWNTHIQLFGVCLPGLVLHHYKKIRRSSGLLACWSVQLSSLITKLNANPVAINQCGSEFELADGWLLHRIEYESLPNIWWTSQEDLSGLGSIGDWRQELGRGRPYQSMKNMWTRSSYREIWRFDGG